MAVVTDSIEIRRKRFWTTKSRMFTMFLHTRITVDLTEFTNIDDPNPEWWSLHNGPDWISTRDNKLFVSTGTADEGNYSVFVVYNNVYGRFFNFTITEGDLLWTDGTGRAWTDGNNIAWGERL